MNPGSYRNRRPSGWVVLAAGGATCLCAYLTLALHSVLPIPFRLRYWSLALAVFLGGSFWAIRRWDNRQPTELPPPASLSTRSPRPALRLALLSWSTLLTLIAVDTVYGVYFNTRVVPQIEAGAGRHSPLISSYEFHAGLPRMLAGPVVKYKPGFTLSATIYGDLCSARDLESATIRDHVVESRQFDVASDEFGFRRSIAPADARLVLLGDSVAMGTGIASPLCVSSQLNAAGTPCYNAAFHGCGLLAQIEYLKSLRSQTDGRLKPEWLVWFVFESNDLEDTVNPVAPADSSSVLQGTVPGAGVRLLEAIRDNSILSRAVSSRLFLLTSTSHQVVDGVHLKSQYYESDRLGRKLFHPTYIERACQPESYVTSHPNRGRLETAFDQMRQQAEQLESQVLVVLVPGAPRVHGAAFTGFPELEPPHFLRLIKQLADSRQFQTLDLLPLMQPSADQTLYFFRDDTHWNEHGHRLAADAIREAVNRQPSN